jgi:hypothetical protein
LFASGEPQTQLLAAGALFSINQDAEAREHLERIGMSNDADLAVAAVGMLAATADLRQARYCFARLAGRWRRVAQVAAQQLRQFPAATIAQLFRYEAPETMRLWLGRLTLTLFLMDSRPENALPENAPELTAFTAAAAQSFPRTAADDLFYFGAAADVKLVLEAWDKNPAAAHLPLLMMIFGAANMTRENRERAGQQLLIFVRDHQRHLLPAPEKWQEFAAWQAWWFDQFRLIALDENRALVRYPDGAAKMITPEMAFDFGAAIDEWRVGRGENNLRGAALIIRCAGKNYALGHE